jgi:hypothetical protein
MEYLIKNTELFFWGIFSGIEGVFFEMPQRMPPKQLDLGVFRSTLLDERQ